MKSEHQALTDGQASLALARMHLGGSINKVIEETGIKKGRAYGIHNGTRPANDEDIATLARHGGLYFFGAEADQRARHTSRVILGIETGLRDADTVSIAVRNAGVLYRSAACDWGNPPGTRLMLGLAAGGVLLKVCGDGPDGEAFRRRVCVTVLEELGVNSAEGRAKLIHLVDEMYEHLLRIIEEHRDALLDEVSDEMRPARENALRLVSLAVKTAYIDGRMRQIAASAATSAEADREKATLMREVVEQKYIEDAEWVVGAVGAGEAYLLRNGFEACTYSGDFDTVIRLARVLLGTDGYHRFYAEGHLFEGPLVDDTHLWPALLAMRWGLGTQAEKAETLANLNAFHLWFTEGEKRQEHAFFRVVSKMPPPTASTYDYPKLMEQIRDIVASM